MNIITHLDDLQPNPRGCVLTIGNFDGLHRGHQAIIAEAHRLARLHQIPLYVMTFEPSPAKLLRPDQAPKRLTPLPVKIKLFQRLQIDTLIIINIDRAFLATPPERFVNDILVKKLNIKHIVEGQTFGFGQRRQAGILDLQTFSRHFHFETHLVPAAAVSIEPGRPAPVSSTLVRSYLAQDQYQHAYQGLGHPLWLTGAIVHGRGQGHKLGYPTANIQLDDPDQLSPQDGVFAAFARFDDSFELAWNQPRLYRAALSIGSCTTFADGAWQIEAFLIDLPDPAPDLYNKHILCTIVEKIRPQQTFANPQELTRAIAHDCQKITDCLNRANPDDYR